MIDRLEEEHEVIADVLEHVDRALVALVGDEPDGIDGCSAAIDLLTDTLLSHLSYEERELVEPLARLGLRPMLLGQRARTVMRHRRWWSCAAVVVGLRPQQVDRPAGVLPPVRVRRARVGAQERGRSLR